MVFESRRHQLSSDGSWVTSVVDSFMIFLYLQLSFPVVRSSLMSYLAGWSSISSGVVQNKHVCLVAYAHLKRLTNRPKARIEII